MTKMKKRLLTIGLSLAMALSTASVALAAPKTPLHTINGGGTIFYPEYGNISESYGFNIRQLDSGNFDGNATGSMQFSWHYPSGGEQSHAQKQYILKADITYVNFDADGDEVWVGGTITKSNINKLTFWINTDSVDPNEPDVHIDTYGTETVDGTDYNVGYSNVDPVVGAPFHIRLQDNGATDKIGYVVFCPTMSQHVGGEYETYLQNFTTGEWAVESLYELTNGNITIK